MRYKNLSELFDGDLSPYTSIPFWSWNNELDESELLRQIAHMQSIGIDGFIMHARTGLKTEYLGEKWFSCVRACIEEAARRHMTVWIYDENGWPSGFAGGRLLREEYLAGYLTYEVLDRFDENADAVFVRRGGRFERVRAAMEADAYYTVTARFHPSYADSLDAAVTDRFIEETHERYYARFSRYFGNVVAGFFTDEPQYFRAGTPYSRTLPAIWRERYGEDLFDGIIDLFRTDEDAGRFRYRYYSLLNELYTDNYYKKIYDWCDAHGCMLTGHSVEECSLDGQMFGCAGVMPSYEYQHIPGIDFLTRNIPDAAAMRQVASVAQQLGRPRVLSEMFGCSGWDATPRELRHLAEYQYLHGINVMCQHLYAYSLKGQGKSDHPPFFSAHNPWTAYARPFYDYFRRLGALLGASREVCRTLVIDPMPSAYLTYERPRGVESIQPLQSEYSALLAELTERGVMYHIGCAAILARHGRVENGVLYVGQCAYDTVVLPSMRSLDAAVAELLTSYCATGGRLCAFGRVPDLVDGVPAGIDLHVSGNVADLTPADEGFLRRPRGVQVSRRTLDGQTYFYLLNMSRTDAAEVGLLRPFDRLRPDDADTERQSDRLTLAPMESALLLPCEGAAAPRKPEVRMTDVTSRFALSSTTANALTLDYAEISYDGATYRPAAFIQRISELLIRDEYNGPLYVRYVFESLCDVPDATVLFENTASCTVTVNGLSLPARRSAWDVNFLEATFAIRKGRNEIVLFMQYRQSPEVKRILYGKDVMESQKNCIVIDTELESVYVFGRFSVDGARRIAPLSPVSGTDNLQRKDYPNFAGEVTYRAVLPLTGRETRLTIGGRYMVARVRIGDRELPPLLTTDTADISGCVHNGDNEVEITLVSGLRNLLGPHHFKPVVAETAVGHHEFDFRGEWLDGGIPDIFTEEYHIVPFGAERIEIG